MIKLIKKTRGGDLMLITRLGEVERSKDGIVLAFRRQDKKKNSFFVTIEKEHLPDLLMEIKGLMNAG